MLKSANPPKQKKKGGRSSLAVVKDENVNKENKDAPVQKGDLEAENQRLQQTLAAIAAERDSFAEIIKDYQLQQQSDGKSPRKSYLKRQVEELGQQLQKEKEDNANEVLSLIETAARANSGETGASVVDTFEAAYKVKRGGLEQRIEQLTLENAQLGRDKEATEAQRAALFAQVEGLNLVKTDLQRRAEAAARTASAEETRVTTLSAEITALRSALEDEKHERMRLKSEKDSAVLREEAAVVHKKSLEEKITELRRNHEEMEQHIKDSRERYKNALVGEFGALNLVNEKIAGERDERLQRMAYEEEYRDMVARNRALESDARDAQRRIQQLERALSEATLGVDEREKKMLHDFTIRERFLERRLVAVEQVKVLLERETEILEGRKDSLMADIRCLEERMNSPYQFVREPGAGVSEGEVLARVQEAVRQQGERHKAHFVEAMTMIQDMLQRQAGEARALQTKVDEVNAVAEVLKAEKHALQAEQFSLQNDFRGMEARLELATAKTGRLEFENGKLSQEVFTLKEEKKALETEVAVLRRDKAAWESDARMSATSRDSVATREHADLYQDAHSLLQQPMMYGHGSTLMYNDYSSISAGSTLTRQGTVRYPGYMM